MSAVLRQNGRNLLVIFFVFLIVFEMVAYISIVPRPQERFFQFYVLGAKHLAADYYPNNDPSIHVGESVQWYVGVTNLMGNVQLVSVRVKFGNQTIEAPSDLDGQPSPAPLLTEFVQFMQHNETWEFPFAWRLSNLTTSGSSVRILELRINDQVILIPDSTARGGYNFRFMLELWSWDTDASGFEFGWNEAGEHRVAWLQVWFNATAT